MSLGINEASQVLILTGAGVSAESGIPTFRDAKGLWRSHRFEDVASPDGFFRDPQLVWRFYSERREGVKRAEPNAGHLALARFEERLGDRFLLVTQNVDGLHERAGSKRLIAMHGNLLQSRCSACSRPPFSDEAVYHDKLPMCSACHKRGRDALLRPHIVWFGEALDDASMTTVYDFMERAAANLIFIAIGTSGNVYPAALLVDQAKALGGRTLLINRDDADNATRFDEVIRGKSGEILPELLA